MFTSAARPSAPRATAPFGASKPSNACVSSAAIPSANPNASRRCRPTTKRWKNSGVWPTKRPRGVKHEPTGEEDEIYEMKIPILLLAAQVILPPGFDFKLNAAEQFVKETVTYKEVGPL